MPKKNNKKNGRPAIELEEIDLKTAGALASKGMSQQQIANFLGISISTLKRKPEIVPFLRKGKAQLLYKVLNGLTATALEPPSDNPKMRAIQLTAQIFIAKTQARWSENNTTISLEDSDIEESDSEFTISSDPIEASSDYAKYITSKKQKIAKKKK